MQKQARKIYIDPSLMIYAVKVVAATRAPEKCGLSDYQRFIQFGASPRASIAMIEAGRALAYIRGRNYVLPAMSWMLQLMCCATVWYQLMRRFQKV